MKKSKAPAQESRATVYEQNQNFNSLISWTHSFRYKYLVEEFNEISIKLGPQPIRVIDIGCAHAKSFGVLNEKFKIDYTGIEVYKDGVEAAQERYGTYHNFKIIKNRVEEEFKHFKDADVILALETLEHIPEDHVVRIIEAIAKTNPQSFICSVPVEIGPAVWFKNIASFATGYSRHKEYTWKETFWAGLVKLDNIPPHGTGHKGFDWHWLAQTIRHNMKIRKIRKSPFKMLPPSFNSSVFFVAEPR